MATISKKEVHKFLDKHPDIPFSAAEFEYSSYLESEAVEYANAIAIARAQQHDLYAVQNDERIEIFFFLEELTRQKSQQILL